MFGVGVLFRVPVRVLATGRKPWSRRPGWTWPRRRSREAGGGQQGGRGQGKPGGNQRGGGRGKSNDRGRKPHRPESYRVVAKAESKPITDAMQKGDEPLRSFGDLMQFYSNQSQPEPAKKPAKENKPKASDSAPPVAETPAETAPAKPEPAANDGNTGEASEAQE
ncbi:hypothetical protein CGZ80_22675 [Rhodopirellula sp. MGV]|nr:hypothetical protein CGZ80_22675 [Rhodopirellula sp. MGV]